MFYQSVGPFFLIGSPPPTPQASVAPGPQDPSEGRHTNCTWVTASRMQFVPVWPPVASKFPAIFSCCMRLAAAQVHHSGTIYMRLATSHMQILHALAASTVQSRQVFEARCENNYLKKNEDVIKKSENLRDTCAC